MKANVITGHGPAGAVFKMTEVPEPTAGPDDLIIRILTTSVNPLDCRIRSKATVQRTFPLILGFDACGIVVEMGSNVKGFKIGDRVLGAPSPFRNGANAAYAAVDYRSCALAGSLSDETAAAIPLAGITAFESLLDRLHIKTGNWAVIHAGAGGVGHLAVQLAKYIGCRVITTASRRESIAYCKDALGADHVVNYREQDVKDKIMDLTAGKGAEVVLDTVGGSTFSQCVDSVAYDGRICSILPVSVDAREGYQLLLKNITLSYQFMGGPLQNPANNRQGIILKRLVEMVEGGLIRPHVSKIYPLEKLSEAHEEMETGHTMGKIIIRVNH